jgi:WD40 repeat protein/pimeloyl-ACP methyl ester carboxylesterase
MTLPRPHHHRSLSSSSGSGYSGITSVQRKFANLLSQRQPSEKSSGEGRGPFGLTLLHSPVETLVDFIFVHGLRGGSFKTWRKHDDARYFWPQTWLPWDSDLSHVRISSFGYNSDWMEWKDSILNIHDFGRSLLGEMTISPYLKRDGNTPIILIGHSMGGLVIKKAYLLAQQEARGIAERIKCMFFLATPHRGSDSASLLNNLLSASGVLSARQYVTDLGRNSLSLQIINDEFKKYANDVELWSFYETVKTSLGLKSAIIVERDSAVLGYGTERSQPLNADHRSVCKFETPEESNFVTIRNALVTAVEDVLQNISSSKNDERRQQMHTLEAYLNVSEAPEVDHSNQEDLKTPGSCQWIDERVTFQAWRDNFDSPVQIYWLSAKPATGKSVCAAHVVSHLQDLGLDCSYYFFKFGNKTKQVLSGLFRSLAYQMALLHPGVRETFYSMQAQHNDFDKDDEGTIWRKLFVNGLLKTKLHRPQFWVIDALDECIAYEKIFPLLLKLDSSFPVRIFMTSRFAPEIDRLFGRLGQLVIGDQISSTDTESDMRLYLDSDATHLPVDDANERAALVEKLLARSTGCFLWVRLVREELEHIYSEEMISDVLEEMPTEMSQIYERSLLAMSKNIREKKLTQAILAWTVCSTRPLKTAELQAALKIDGSIQVRNVKQSIEALCGQLLYVDKHDYVQIIHSTARNFLLDRELDSEFAVRREIAHERLAKACLKFMEEEIRPPRSRSLGSAMAMAKAERPVLAEYASTAFSEHLFGSSAVSDSLLVSLARFLTSNALAWIEYIAVEKKNLYVLTRTAKNFKRYLERRAKYVSPLGREVQTVDGWSTDLIRLVAKFGTNLLSYPSSIFFLIPPFAPPESALYQQIKAGPVWLEVVGLSGTSWDDCVSYIEYRDSWATALACGENVFAIGMKNGRISVYDQSTCQEKQILNHEEPVKLLAFDQLTNRLASAGPKTLRVWTLNGEQLQAFELQQPCVTLAFAKEGNGLIVVNRGSRLVRWNLDDHSIRRESICTGTLPGQGQKTIRQAPIAATISPDQTILALLYRGRPIHLWSLEDDTLLGLCGRDVGSKTTNISVQTALFNPNPDLGLLAVAYQDGELALYNAWSQKELNSVDGNAFTLASSPDGRTLATGDTRGTVQIWDFESLTLLYRINSGCDEVKSLAFSGDGYRLADIRDSKTKVWEPSALVRRTLDEDSSVSDALALQVPTVGVNEDSIDITVLVVDAKGETVFAGRGDGSIVTFDARSGKMHGLLYSHKRDIFVTVIACNEHMIASADAGGRVLAWKLKPEDTAAVGTDTPILDHHMSEPVQHLLLNHRGDRMLISTNSSDYLWLLSGQATSTCLDTIPCPISTQRQWLSQSEDGSDLHLLVENDLRTYSWEDFASISTTPLHQSKPKIMHMNDEQLKVTDFLTDSRGDHLIAASSRTLGDKSIAQLLVWINPWQKSDRPRIIHPEPVLVLPAKRIKTFLGVRDTRIIFLDRDLWVCSIDLAEMGAKDGSSDIRRHCFVPHEFVGGPNGVLASVTSQGSVVFAKEGELAVVKGGLEWSC